MSDVSWTVHTASTTIDAQSAINEAREINTLTRGERATFNFRFQPDADTNALDSVATLTISANDTTTIQANETITRPAVDVKENGTLDVKENGIFNAAGGELTKIREFADYAGAFSTQVTLNNTQLYRERLPNDASIDSLVLGIEPSQTLKDKGIQGVWGLITSATDTRNTALTDYTYEIEVRILDEFDAYSDYTNVKNDLEV